jgi:hypothetical protein
MQASTNSAVMDGRFSTFAVTDDRKNKPRPRMVAWLTFATRMAAKDYR